MKPILTIVCSILIMAQTSMTMAAEILVQVNGIEAKRGGNIIVMIFSEAGFPMNHQKALFTQTKNSRKNTLDFLFDVDMEEIAVKVLHDENKDGKVTKNWTGIYPKEGLGFSNGQYISLTGPPKYSNCKLSKTQIQNGVKIAIKYP